MSSDTEESSPTGIPPKLCTSINALRDTLDPVLSQTWSSSVDALSALERAKVDIMIAYTLVDLVWVYLKTRGINPAEHPVTAELERVKGYYVKLRRAEDPNYDKPRMRPDVPAITRFINHSIPRAQRLAPGNQSTNTPSSSSGSGSINGQQQPGSTSAAQAAAAGAARAVAEQDAAMQAANGFRSERFRHFAKGEGERVVSGQPGVGDGLEIEEEEEQKEEEEEGEEEEEEEEEEPVFGLSDTESRDDPQQSPYADDREEEGDGEDVDMERDMGEETEAFLRGLQDEMDGASPAEPTDGASTTSEGKAAAEVSTGSKNGRGKRKRPSAL